MSLISIITMIIVCGLIWGGFISLLINAIKNEKLK